MKMVSFTSLCSIVLLMVAMFSLSGAKPQFFSQSFARPQFSDQAFARRPGFCSLGPETGFCKARFNMFFYNSFSNTCEVFIYGGCRGNRNRFSNYQACIQACG